MKARAKVIILSIFHSLLIIMCSYLPVAAQETESLLLQLITQYENPENREWQDANRLLRTYDQKGRKINEKSYHLFRPSNFENCDSSWLKVHEELWKYDGNDSLVVHERIEYNYSQDFENESCDPQTNYNLNRVEYTYNREGLLESEINIYKYQYANEKYRNVTTTTYTYDSNGCLILSEAESEDTSYGKYTYSTQYMRDSNCNILYQEDESNKLDFTYNGAGQILGLNHYFFQNGMWELVFVSQYSYDENGILEESTEFQYWDPVPQMTITKYDPKGNPIQRTELSLDDNDEVLDTLSIETSEWDDQGNLVQELHRDKTGEYTYAHTFTTNSNNQIFQEEFLIESTFYDSSRYSRYYQIITYDYDAGGLLITKNITYNYSMFDSDYLYEDSGETQEYYTYRCDGAMVERLVETITNGWPSSFKELSYYSPATCEPENEPAVLKIYPNPSNGWLNIESELLHKPGTVIRIIDSMGREYFADLAAIGQTGRIDVRDLKPGIYVISLVNASQRVSGRAMIEPR